MGLILPSRLNSQSQILAIDWGNPLTQGLDLAIDSAAGRDLITGLFLTAAGTKLVPAGSALLRGFGTRGGSSSDIQTSSYTTNSTARSYVFTYLATSFGGGTFGRIWQKSAGSIGSDSCYATSAAGNYLQFVRQNTTANITYGIGVLGVPHVGVFTHDGINNAGANFWLDGVQQVNTGTGASSANSAPDAGVYYIGNRSDLTRNWDGLIGVILAFNRVLSPAEALSLSNNPWQLFKAPRSDWIPVLPTAGLAGRTATSAITLADVTGVAADKVASNAAISTTLVDVAGAAAGKVASNAAASVTLAGTTGSMPATNAAKANQTTTLAGTGSSMAATAASKAAQSTTLADVTISSAATNAAKINQSATLAGTTGSGDISSGASLPIRSADALVALAGTSSVTAGTSLVTAVSSVTLAGCTGTAASKTASIAVCSATLQGTSAPTVSKVAGKAAQSTTLEGTVGESSFVATRTAVMVALLEGCTAATAGRVASNAAMFTNLAGTVGECSIAPRRPVSDVDDSVGGTYGSIPQQLADRAGGSGAIDLLTRIQEERVDLASELRRRGIR